MVGGGKETQFLVSILRYCLHSNGFITASRALFMKSFFTWDLLYFESHAFQFLLILLWNFNFLWAERNPASGFRKAGSDFIFSAFLTQDDSRKVVMQKLRVVADF